MYCTAEFNSFQKPSVTLMPIYFAITKTADKVRELELFTVIFPISCKPNKHERRTATRESQGHIPYNIISANKTCQSVKRIRL